MPIEKSSPVWPQRLESIEHDPIEIAMPGDIKADVAQDDEWCFATVDGERRRIRFHDYHKIYDVPGLYEHLFYDALECCSPNRVVNLLHDVLDDEALDASELRVLDVGAGNGMVGDELAELGVDDLVGVDIIPEARKAARRDRPRLYQEYFIADLTDLNEQREEKLRAYNFNCMSLVAALGFGDIPPQAFLKALDLVDTPAWLAFNIKEDFLDDDDVSGFTGLIKDLDRQGIIKIQAYRRYQHRLSMRGEPLYYVAMVAQKQQDVPDDIMESWR